MNQKYIIRRISFCSTRKELGEVFQELESIICEGLNTDPPNKERERLYEILCEEHNKKASCLVF